MGIVLRTLSCAASISETVPSPRLLTTTVEPSGETCANPGAAPTRILPSTSRLSKIQHGHVRRFGIRDVGPFAVRRDVDEIRSGMHPDGGHHLVAFRIDHADAVRLRVHDVDFVFPGVGRNAGRLIADSNRPGRLKSAQVNHRNGVALAVGDVGVLAIGGAVGGQLAFLEVPPSQTADRWPA